MHLVRPALFLVGIVAASVVFVFTISRSPDPEPRAGAPAPTKVDTLIAVGTGGQVISVPNGGVQIAGGTLDMNNAHKIVNVVDPTANQDAATKHYVDTSAGNVTGTFTTNTLPKGTAAHTLGDSSETDDGTTFSAGTHFTVTTATGAGTTTGGFTCSAPSNATALTVTNAATAQASSGVDASISDTATIDATASARTQDTLKLSCNATRSAGANAVTCQALEVVKNTGAQNNYGLVTDPGVRNGFGWAPSQSASFPAAVLYAASDASTGGDPGNNVTLVRNSSSAGGVKSNWVRTRGTLASPTTTQLSDLVGQVNYDLVDSTNTVVTAGQQFYIQDQNAAAGAAPMSFEWLTTGMSGNALTEVMRLDSIGHLIFGVVTTTSVTSCGSGASVDGTDTAGTITVGTGATGCTLNFATAWNVPSLSRTPHCLVKSEANVGFTYATSVTAVTITNVGDTSSTKLDYMCVGGGTS